MNRSQKLLTFAALALFGASILFAPWASGSARGWRLIRHGLIFLAPEDTSYLQWGNLFAEWVALGILYGWLYWLFGRLQMTRKIIAGGVIVLAAVIGIAYLVAIYTRVPSPLIAH